MNYKDQMLKLTRQECDAVMRNLEAIPEDKRTWQVEGKGRTALDIAQEVAQSPTWGSAILLAGNCDGFNEETMTQAHAERVNWDLDACRKNLDQNLEAFEKVVQDFPEERLDDQIHLPFGPDGGFDESFAGIVAFPYWNATYHTGQLAFIQTLLGDMDFH